MPGRGVILMFLLFFCGLLIAACVSDTAGPVGSAPPEGRNQTPPVVSVRTNQTYAYAKSLVPLEIPGFVLRSREKEPMSFWAEPYHVHSYWTPENTSEFNGSVKSLSVDVFVYDDTEEGRAWFQTFGADSDGPLVIQGIGTVYRFRGGVAEIVFTRDDIIVYSSSVADRSSAGPGAGEGAAREAAVTGAEMVIRNLK